MTVLLYVIYVPHKVDVCHENIRCIYKKTAGIHFLIISEPTEI
jgi:hypothetical protein